MSIRRDPIYISNEVYRLLWLIAKAEQSKYEGRTNVQMTPDMQADQLLRQTIEEKYPLLLEHQKKLDKLEKETIQSLRDENSTVPGTGDKGAKS